MMAIGSYPDNKHVDKKKRKERKEKEAGRVFIRTTRQKL
jgi:hypothetical protein